MPQFSSVHSVQFGSRTLPAPTLIDLAGSVRLRLGSVHGVSNCLGGAEQQLYDPSSGNLSPPARGLPSGWRNGLCWLHFIACLGRGVESQRRKFSSKSFKKSSFSSIRLPDRVGCQFVQFSLGHMGQVPPLSSFSSVHDLIRPRYSPHSRHC